MPLIVADDNHQDPMDAGQPLYRKRSRALLGAGNIYLSCRWLPSREPVRQCTRYHAPAGLPAGVLSRSNAPKSESGRLFSPASDAVCGSDSPDEGDGLGAEPIYVSLPYVGGVENEIRPGGRKSWRRLLLPGTSGGAFYNAACQAKLAPARAPTGGKIQFEQSRQHRWLHGRRSRRDKPARNRQSRRSPVDPE